MPSPVTDGYTSIPFREVNRILEYSFKILLYVFYSIFVFVQNVPIETLKKKDMYTFNPHAKIHGLYAGIKHKTKIIPTVWSISG